MKTLIVAVALALMGVQSAAAQPAVLVKSKPIQGTVPDFHSELPGKVLRWTNAETERQFEAPTEMFDLEFGMLKELEPDLQRVAKRQHLAMEEVKVMVMYEVITGAAKKMDRAVHDRREAIAKAGVPDKQDPELRALGARKAALLALIQELGPRMTPNTRLLSGSSNPGDLANMGAKGK